MKKLKIHCEEVLKSNEDYLKGDPVNSVGFYQPQIDGKTWTILLVDGGYFDVESQFEAEVISSLEQIKALLLNMKKEDNE